MIVLQIQLTANQNEESKLEEAVRERFLPAMSQQPGFIQSMVCRPGSDEIVSAVGGKNPGYSLQVTALWNSEAERRTWATVEIHDKVWGEVRGLCAEVNGLLLDPLKTWKI